MDTRKKGRPLGTGGAAAYLKPEEITRIDKCMIGTENELRNRAIFFFGLSSGCRISEIVALKIGQLLGDNRNKLNDYISIEKHSNKSRRSREIYIGRRGIKELTTYLKDRFQGDLSKADKDQPLFQSRNGKHLHPRSANRILKIIFEKAGVLNASSHSLRRTFCSRLHEALTPLKVLQELMGHRHLSSTSLYINTTPQDRRKAIDKLKL
jgi:integrase/recombinase XerD